MTTQEIYEREGYIVYCSDLPLPIGSVETEEYENAVLPKDAAVVITEQITLSEALKWAERNGLPIQPPDPRLKFFYKAVAE